MGAALGCRWDFSGGQSDWNASDCDGHGTHVASVAAGRTVGVAKEANVVAVQVLDCDGSGTISTVTAGKSHTGQPVSGRSAALIPRGITISIDLRWVEREPRIYSTLLRGFLRSIWHNL